jgi:hypothetical protein
MQLELLQVHRNEQMTEYNALEWNKKSIMIISGAYLLYYKPASLAAANAEFSCLEEQSGCEHDAIHKYHVFSI